MVGDGCIGALIICGGVIGTASMVCTVESSDARTGGMLKSMDGITVGGQSQLPGATSGGSRWLDVLWVLVDTMFPPPCVR